jgi:septal ring factor EnvC (AmiA/AmiB activator)
LLSTIRREQRAIRKQKQASDTLRAEIQELDGHIDTLAKQLELYRTSEELQRLQAQQKALQNKLPALIADCSVEENKRVLVPVP